MSEVIQFYRKIIEWGIVEKGTIQNKPFEEFSVGIQYINSKGMLAIMSALTTDISFRVSGSDDDDPHIIKDGENLIPLSLDDQAVVFAALSEYGNRTFELMAHVAILTGARLQTVSTLRISDIRTLSKKKPNKYGEVLLGVGRGHLADLKGEKRYNKRALVFFPLSLVRELLDYADSDLARNLRNKSFYGDTDENYLFLNEEGRPYYTSLKEQADRVNPTYSKRLSLRDRVDFPIADGQAVNNLMGRLKTYIHDKHPDFRNFRFHDFRATYGMNFLRSWINAGKKPNVGVGELKGRMGHSSVQTTYQYLNYAAEVEGITEMEDAHYEILNGRSPS